MPLVYLLKSAAPPEENASGPAVEVNHVAALEANLAAKVLSDDALPGGVEAFIEVGFQISRQLHVRNLLLRVLGCLVLHEFDSLQLQICTHTKSASSQTTRYLP